jgi:hypothetical protein
LQVVQALNSDQPWGRIAHLLEDVHTILHGIPFHQAQYARSDANKVAHTLTKFVISQSNGLVWLDECPSSIIHLVIADHGSFQ